MSQVLFLGKGKYITIDRSWADAGKPVRYGLVGGQMVQLTDGTKPHPEILMAGREFFYKNGEPVTKAEDVDWIEEPYRTQALNYVQKAQVGDAEPIRVHESQSEAAAVEPKRGRGRPKKAAPEGPKKIEIKDARSFAEVAGADLDSFAEEN